jgi:hypothetical protein
MHWLKYCTKMYEFCPIDDLRPTDNLFDNVLCRLDEIIDLAITWLTDSNGSAAKTMLCQMIFSSIQVRRHSKSDDLFANILGMFRSYKI